MYALLIFIGALFFSIAPFLHINMAKNNPKVEHFKKQLKEKEKTFETAIDKRRYLLKTNKISSLNFLKQTDSIFTSKKAFILKSNIELNKLIDENRVFGFRTKRTFTIGFFVRLPYLLFSITILMLYLEKKKVKYLSKSIEFLIFNFFFISFYHLIWFLWDSNDLPKSTYYIAISIISIILSFSFINVIRYIYNKEGLLNRKIQGLIHFITYSRENVIKELAVKAIRNNDTEIKNVNTLIELHENEMWKTLEKTAE